jgi:hypothetical protein
MSEYAKAKFQASIRLARMASRDSWQLDSLDPSTLKALRTVSRHAIRDARYWKRQP